MNEFTPYTRNDGQRLRLELSPADWAKIGKGKPWRATVTDLKTGIRYRARGTSCGLPHCFCDAVAVPVPKRHPD